MKEQTLISLCSDCQKEFPEIDNRVRKLSKKYGLDGEISVSHGLCLRHFAQQLKSYGASIEQIKSALKQAKKNNEACPDLKERPDLVKQYSSGNFLNTQSETKIFTERLKKLAGIKGQ